MTGASIGAFTPPVSPLDPLAPELESSASTVTEVLLALEPPGTHVALQRPAPKGSIESGGSPLENDAITEPSSTEVPQSSTTSTSKETGHAAGILNWLGNPAKAGNNVDGTHPDAAPRTVWLETTGAVVRIKST